MNTWHSWPNTLFNRCSTKTCMAGRNCSKAIRAHSISHARVLKKISESGKAVTIVPSDSVDYAMTFGLRGIGQISTFTGFCAKHDQELFISIDAKDYELENKQQEFFFAYRAVAQSFWYTYTESRMQKAWSTTLDNAKPKSKDKLPELESLRIQQRLRAEKCRQTSNLWRDIKDAQHIHIYNSNYAAMDSLILHFPDAYPVGFSGLIHLLHGREREEALADPHIVAINAFPQNGKYYAILTCINASHKHYLEEMLASYYALGITDNRTLLTHLICGNSEALAFNPTYWEQLSSRVRDSFIGRWKASKSMDFDTYPDPSLNIFNDKIVNQQTYEIVRGCF